ncbi:glycosyl hydrolase 2 galactose-binding domain-containing protein [Mesorhizobium sp. BE184]|uniref:glycoside hydrolase family 2 protein n=1 Tax=Mesorhizobium sp. BE184 TaxID=2817714 RepID=UPI00386207ED
MISPLEQTDRLLDRGWRMAVTPAGAWADPSACDNAKLIDAQVPGTVAGALERAGKFDRAAPQPLNGQDAWYLVDLAGEAPGAATLRFEGLATIAEIFLNDRLVAASNSMFVALDVPVILTGTDRLAICFRALAPYLDQRGRRARWRPQMITPQGLRLTRTSLIGYMPGWCPEVHPAGPFRPIRLFRDASPAPRDVVMRAGLDEAGNGRLDIRFSAHGLRGPVKVVCADREAELVRDGDCFSGSLLLPSIEAWWPHTHGRPALQDVTIVTADGAHPAGRTGFRRIEIDRGADGKDFAILINGERVFCRGAVWTNADMANLPGTREGYEPWLRLAADSGMNMLRIPGTMTYETPDFFRLCDELGIMVWQDFMFANFDYPGEDPDFAALVEQEARQFLQGTSASPSLAVLCGGSEMAQQAAMLGLPQASWSGPLTDEILPGVATEIRPDLPYVPNSPCGGAMPFSPNAGVTHYYGVGAYCRPLDDARRANMRFAAESLAFANVPEQSTLDTHLPVPAAHDPRWKARVPRDRGASWDFEDIRDHYLADLYGHDPIRLRRENPTHYLDLSRIVSAEVMEATFAEWRRPGSSCNGALVLSLQDFLPGAGWGVIDATGTPKPAFHALRRAFRPVQILLSDEGTNGVDVHVLNETAAARELRIELVCLRDGSVPVVRGESIVTLAARQGMTLPATQIFGAFFDTNYAFRFGPPSHDVTVARLKDAQTGAVISEAFHFPLGRAAALGNTEVSVELSEDSEGWLLTLSASHLAQGVQIDAPGFSAGDNWFNLAPHEPRLVRFSRRSSEAKPFGDVRAINMKSTVQF